VKHNVAWQLSDVCKFIIVIHM